MQVLLNDEKKLFKDNAKQFISEYFNNNKLIDLRLLWKTLHKNNFISIGDSFLNNILLTEAACVVKPGVGLFLLTQFTCIEIIERYAHNLIKENYLPKLYSGECIGCFSLTEPNAGSDISMIETTAKKEGASWLINGQKIWSSNGSISDIIITFAQTKNYKDKSGITSFIVPSKINGVEILNDTPKLGVKITPSNEVKFKNTKIDTDSQISEIGDGIKIALGAITLGRIYCAAQAIGLLEGVINESIKHSTKRNQFGKSISENQAIQWYIADMTKDLDACRLLLYKACFMKENNKADLTKLSSMAKYFSTESAQKHATKAVQILGGTGLKETSYVANAYTDAKVLEIYEGTNEIQKIIIAKELKFN